jgi:PAS domain S-box-containing protein
MGSGRPADKLTMAKASRPAEPTVSVAVHGQPEGRRPLSLGDFSTWLDRFDDGLVVLDLDGRCRYLNDAASAMLGLPPGELLGRQIWASLSESFGLSLRLACESAASSGRSVQLVEPGVEPGSWIESRVLEYDGDLVVMLRNVTQEQLAHNELIKYVERISEAERIVRFGVWEWELECGRVRWSDELHRIYGLRPGEFGGTLDAFIEHLHPDDRDRVWTNISRSLETREPFVFEERIRRADGEERVLLSQGRVIVGPDGAPQALVGVCHDVTDRAQIERALGASERRMRAIIDNTPSLVSVKDLSGRYLMSNAESGRVLGMSAEDIVGKFCSDLFPPEIAQGQRANDRRAASEGEPVYDEAVLVRDGATRTYITATFALPDDEGFPVETCTIATDVTERRERESARREREVWVGRIGSALEDERMLVFGQPIFDLSTGGHVSSELLVRMRNPGERTELLMPDHFLVPAERFGLVQLIDIWMVRRATALPASIVPQVNLSAITMCDEAARREIVEILTAAPEAASRIVFEITETAAAEHLEAASAFAHEVGRLGCRLALDDFGTGFGSFTYLRSLPLSYLKIDLSFVRDLVESVDDRRVVQSIISIAEQFDLATIAEGVENQATLELLRELGANYAQGFHLGPPSPLD